ncbi:MAG: hypothetical protein JNL54_02490 [Kineosporiaceae bacterium]|nr:hypothetical protein [Kineosporiaceae bacterium]
MRPASPLASGEERHVGLDELFFSTTDRRGIIKTGNSVFMRISRYHAEELIGAPHSVVRHPAMPAGAFRLMWDRLLSGRPMAAYVDNLAKDGASYRVFATVTPLGEDFLSVRMAPAGPLASAATALYAGVRAFEGNLARTQQLSGPEVAAAGAQQIERELARLGFEDYDDFMLAALPTEVAARGSVLARAFTRTHTTGPLGDILATTTRVNERLDHLVERLGGYRGLIEQLGPATDTVYQQASSLQRSVEAALQASAEVAATTPVLLNVARVMRQPMGSAVEALRALSLELTALRHEVADLGFRIALARLHTEMVRAFTVEVIDGQAPPSSLAEVPRLCQAVHAGVLAMGQAIEDVNHSLTTVSLQIRDAGALMRDFRNFLGQWRILTVRHRQAAAVADHLGPIDLQLDSMADHLDFLESLAVHCHGSVAPFDRLALDPDLNRITALLGYSPV